MYIHISRGHNLDHSIKFYKILTNIATYNVADIEPKYVTVKGNLSTLIRCLK
jgi:hypothetical protein